MRARLTPSAFALVAAVWAAPASAEDTAAVERELAEMRAQMAAMASRIDTLEAQLVAAKEQAGAEEPQPATSIAWKGAPVIEGPGGWSFKPRGRLQFDAGFTEAPDATQRSDGFGSEARRIRLGVEGTIPGGFGYKMEADFAGNEVELADAIVTYERGGLTLAAGQHNTFQSLEELTSSRFTSFMERAAFTDAFGFERRVGASAQYAGGPVLVQAGVFTDNIDALSNQNWSADGRVVFMSRMGATQLHLGGSVHYADLESGSTARYRQRPFVHFTDERFLDTGNMLASSETGYGLEAAAIRGRFHAAGEAFWQKVSRPVGLSDPTFTGGYAEAGVFLTRDTRGYKNGTFDRIKPKNPVGEGGFGAVQVNVRYDWLDLVDAGIIGGTQDGYGLSLIWTPTAYTRLMMNYGRMQYDRAIYPAAGGDRSYTVDAFGVRAQLDF